jgi:hypothetical protein
VSDKHKSVAATVLQHLCQVLLLLQLLLQCVALSDAPAPFPLPDCAAYSIVDPAIGGTAQLYTAAGAELVGCRDKTAPATSCTAPYSVFFKQGTQVLFCQPGFAAGKNCSSLYGGFFSVPQINNGELVGCSAPATCYPATSLLFYENVGGNPTQVGCGPRFPNSCDTKYAGKYVALKDGGNATGGVQIGCLKLDTTNGAPGSDQVCPAGYDFFWYTSAATPAVRAPVLKECWVSNGGNNNW